MVWKALNDPSVLSQCVPGCESFDLTGESQYKVVMQVAVGPIRSKFTGKLLLSDIVAPHSYKISFDGSGGVAGSGKGHAVVKLEELGEQTKLTYAVNAQVGGRLAQVGARLIDGVAKRMADMFFEKFKEKITKSEGNDNLIAKPSAVALPKSSKGIWLLIAVVAAAFVVYYTTR
jgi:carbon monoxide dehydrogenase subunit G